MSVHVSDTIPSPAFLVYCMKTEKKAKKKKVTVSIQNDRSLFFSYFFSKNTLKVLIHVKV